MRKCSAFRYLPTSAEKMGFKKLVFLHTFNTNMYLIIWQSFAVPWVRSTPLHLEKSYNAYAKNLAKKETLEKG